MVMIYGISEREFLIYDFFSVGENFFVFGFLFFMFSNNVSFYIENRKWIIIWLMG